MFQRGWAIGSKAGGQRLAHLRQPRAGHPPRLADRALAAGHPHAGDPARPLEALEAAEEDLPAPDRPVGAEARAVVDRADRRPGLAVLGERRGEVRVMVLDADELDALALLRVARREVVGVQVVCDDLGHDLEQLLEVRDAVLQRRQRLVVLDVADVVAAPRAIALRDAERVLLLGAGAEHVAWRGDRQVERGRHVAARAAHEQRALADDADDGVVGARRDRAVVDEEAVGDRAQALERVGVVVGDRLVGDVAARHDERHAGVDGEQLVQRRVREHDAEVGRAGRDGGRDGRVRQAAREDDRALARAQQLLRALADLDERARQLDVGDEQRERAVLAVLAAAQRGDRRLVVGTAGEVIAAEPLDREDPPVEQVLHGVAHGVVALDASSRRVRAGAPAARRRDTRWAARGSGGRAGRRTRPGRRRT